MDILLLVAALIIILAGAEAFINALEHLGDRLGISDGVTGSIFAAVGTALPEAMVPVVAVFAATSGQPVHLGEEVGVGAILGAPMMLSTLTLFMMALFVSPQRGWRGALNPEPTGLRRDLGWFLSAFHMVNVPVKKAAELLHRPSPNARLAVSREYNRNLHRDSSRSSALRGAESVA